MVRYFLVIEDGFVVGKRAVGPPGLETPPPSWQEVTQQTYFSVSLGFERMLDGTFTASMNTEADPFRPDNKEETQMRKVIRLEVALRKLRGIEGKINSLEARMAALERR